MALVILSVWQAYRRGYKVGYRTEYQRSQREHIFGVIRMAIEQAYLDYVDKHPTPKQIIVPKTAYKAAMRELAIQNKREGEEYVLTCWTIPIIGGSIKGITFVA